MGWFWDHFWVMKESEEKLKDKIIQSTKKIKKKFKKSKYY